MLLGLNAFGTDKLKPAVIEKSFTNVKSLPVIYRANSKAWMTSAIWKETMKMLDKKICSQKRNVVFIINNFAVHSVVKGLKAIKFIYMSPNAMSVL